MENTHETDSNTTQTPHPQETTTTAEATVIDHIAESPALPTPTPSHKGKYLIGALLIALILLGGAGYFIYTQNYKDGGVVATVNGSKIYKNELEESIGIIEQAAIAQQIDITQETAKQEIQQQALDVLVNNALIISGAKKAGFVASEEDIQKKYDELVASVGNIEELNARMASVGLTEAKLRENIKERILADQYIESETPIEEITVTDEEITAFLTSLNVDIATLPPMEELKPQLEAEIINQKQQKIVEELIKTLRSDANIVVKI